MTFETLTLNIPALQEGNIADLLDVEFAPEFPLTDVAEVECRILQQGSQKAYVTKKLSAGTVNITGQVLNVPLLEADTAGHAGSYNYECDFINADGKSFFTIVGKGTINAQIK